VGVSILPRRAYDDERVPLCCHRWSEKRIAREWRVTTASDERKKGNVSRVSTGGGGLAQQPQRSVKRTVGKKKEGAPLHQREISSEPFPKEEA